MANKLPNQPHLREVAAQFEIPGTFCSAVPYGSGHINDTYAVTFSEHGLPRRWLFQRINERVFTKPWEVMENIVRVSEHLRGKLRERLGREALREVLTVIPTRDGEDFLRTAAGEFWRVYVFIEGARTYDVVTDPQQAVEAARAFGAFQKDLADLPDPPLHEGIPDFHNTPKRFVALRDAVDRDPLGRAAECTPEIEWALAQEPMTRLVTDALVSGELPRRVTHNDTKINNVMIDDASGRGICVIDLDTVMPGSVLYDFGDQVRTSAHGFAENERDLSVVRLDLDRYECLIRGYLDTAAAFLTPREIELLPAAGCLLTYECGIRFLADHLVGDTYFKIHRPGENLDRARTQFEFVRDMQRHEDELRQLVNRYL